MRHLPVSLFQNRINQTLLKVKSSVYAVIAYGVPVRRLAGSRYVSVCCPTGANDVMFQSFFCLLRSLYADLVLLIHDMRIMVSVVLICSMNWSHKWMGHVGLMEYSVVMMWYAESLQPCSAMFTLGFYDSTNCRSVSLDGTLLLCRSIH